MITLSVFRLAARRTDLTALIPRLGIRAGERKTGWTKPLPLSPGLWALNVAGFLVGLRLGVRSGDWGAIRGRPPSLGSISPARIWPLAAAPARQQPSRRKRSRPDPAGVSLSRGRNVDAGS